MSFIRNVIIIFIPTYLFAAKIAIITSLYNGDLFIQQHLQTITQQTIFHNCIWYIINANSPGSEERHIKPYLEKYKNIQYVKLDHDPGLYAVWNMMIKMGNEPYIINANVDDRLSAQAVEQLSKMLDENPTIDLVYGDYYAAPYPNMVFEYFLIHQNSKRSYLPTFSIPSMRVCLPGPFPMWRRTLHDRFGFFNEEYKSAGDYEMWLRAVAGGSCFRKTDIITGVYYINPQGISSRPNSLSSQETTQIYQQYSFLWNKKHPQLH